MDTEPVPQSQKDAAMRAYENAYGGHTASHAAPNTETDEHRYARQTRNAVVTIAVIISVLVVLSLIASVIGIIAVNNVANVLSSAG